MSRFQTIVFGENEHGFWNEPTYHSSQSAASRWGLNLWNVAGVLGYVVIKIDHETWEVVDEESRIPDYSVSFDGYGFVKVQKSPQLVMV
jgi:hypothetical protein